MEILAFVLEAHWVEDTVSYAVGYFRVHTAWPLRLWCLGPEMAQVWMCWRLTRSPSAVVIWVALTGNCCTSHFPVLETMFGLEKLKSYASCAWGVGLRTPCFPKCCHSEDLLSFHYVLKTFWALVFVNLWHCIIGHTNLGSVASEELSLEQKGLQPQVEESMARNTSCLHHALLSASDHPLDTVSTSKHLVLPSLQKKVWQWE